MEFADVVRRRKMVRTFTNEPVDRAVLDGILAAAVRAPSAGFTQGWGFLVLDTRMDTERFWNTTFAPDDRAAFRWQGLFDAPVIVVPCSNESAYLDRYAEPDKGWTDRDPARWPVPFWHIDTAFASMQILNAVVDAGLGALFFGVFGENVLLVRAAFGVPDTFMPIGAIAIGHPAPSDEPSPSLRRGWKDRDDVIHFNRW
ncbi:MAG TPA: nitroreductase family protein [Acidimicrobiales bacterium]|nr:nitroreductase family protein [Acidimicrobiales bacterium]